MPDFDLIIRNGKIATADAVTEGDIGIRDGKIAAVEAGLSGAAQTIDAGGHWVTPGGVDGHCHLDQPTSDGTRMADDFRSGTISAAHGGTTTVIPFACQFKGQSLNDVVADYHGRAEGKAVIDYAFHLIVSDPSPTVLETELPALIGKGYTHFKLYMTYDDMKLNDRQMLDVLELARRHGAMVMIHAENSDCIAWLTERLEAAQKTAPYFHAVSRPPVIEREATYRAIAFSDLMDTPILIVHVSGQQATEEIRRAQARGLRIYGETCPQYLFLTADDLRKDGFEGAKCICSPPPRTVADQKYMWSALADGVFSVFSSDHAPFRYADPQGKQIEQAKQGFRWVPNGVPGLETRVPLLFSHGVLDGRIDITEFVALTSTNPARMYGIEASKGSIAPGLDADIVVWDEKPPFRLSNTMLHHNVDYTPYEGIELKAWPGIVMSRGDVIIRDGAMNAAPGRGRFLPSAPPAPARPSRPDDPTPYFMTA
jgi:dihydropyrimidinase